MQCRTGEPPTHSELEASQKNGIGGNWSYGLVGPVPARLGQSLELIPSMSKRQQRVGQTTWAVPKAWGCGRDTR